MAIDVPAQRLNSAEKIRDNGLLVTVREPLFAGGIRTGQTDRQTWALQTSSTVFPLFRDMAEGSGVKMLISALEWDPAGGAWADPLDLTMTHTVQYLGKWLSVFDPGEVAPPGQIILYKAVLGVREGAA